MPTMAAGIPVILRRTASAGPLSTIPPPESTSVPSVVPKGAFLRLQTKLLLVMEMIKPL